MQCLALVYFEDGCLSWINMFQSGFLPHSSFFTSLHLHFKFTNKEWAPRIPLTLFSGFPSLLLTLPHPTPLHPVSHVISLKKNNKLVFSEFPEAFCNPMRTMMAGLAIALVSHRLRLARLLSLYFFQHRKTKQNKKLPKVGETINWETELMPPLFHNLGWTADPV